MSRRLTPAVILGLGDGAMSILGVIAYASGHARMVLPLAASGGISAPLSMGGNEWLSESDSGFGAALAMAGATLAGSVIPALPYAFLAGWPAAAVSLGSLLAVALAVGAMRAGRRHPYLETIAVLAVIAAASVGCALLLPGGAG